MGAVALAGFCGRCGAPFAADHGAFCGRCGGPLVAAPAVATGYSYPVMPSAAVPAAHHRMSHARLLIFAGAGLAVIVVVITLIAVLAKPAAQTCGFYCGPNQGSRLFAPTHYVSSAFGYSVEYDSTYFKVLSQDANGVALQPMHGGGEITFTAASGGDVAGANASALQGLPGSSFQDVQPVGPVRGAEIGLVGGQGTAYRAQFVPANSTTATPVGITIFSATQNGVTITVVAFSKYDDTGRGGPYGLALGQLFDFPVTNTVWKGSQ